MRILGIETSCDETAAAIIETDYGGKNVRLLANVVASSLPFHAKTGGIIPEVAARQQTTSILPVLEEALKTIGWEPPYKGGAKELPAIDAIAVTYGPGLIGSLLVGVETAKTLSYVWNKPLIPVNHLYGHIYANWIDSKTTGNKRFTDENIPFPALALIVSGGHTDLVVLKNHGDITWIGGTRDDAAGEAFDKIGRLLGLPYPAGPTIEKLAKSGTPKAYAFPRPMIGTNDFDFSFSGLKTAVFREVQTMKELNNQTIVDLSASVQQAIFDVLIKKTIKAAQMYQVQSVLFGGGVAANQTLLEQFAQSAQRFQLNASFFVPEKNLCTDNAAMIATAAFYNNQEIPWHELTANPELYFD